MKKIKAILIGWGKNWGLIPTTEAEKELSKLRLTFCVKCPLAEKSKILELINDEAEYVDILFCTKCTCGCEAKSLVVKEHCPINNW